MYDVYYTAWTVIYTAGRNAVDLFRVLHIILHPYVVIEIHHSTDAFHKTRHCYDGCHHMYRIDVCKIFKSKLLQISNVSDMDGVTIQSFVYRYMRCK